MNILRKTDGQTEKETDRQTEKETHRLRKRHTDKERQSRKYSLKSKKKNLKIGVPKG